MREFTDHMGFYADLDDPKTYDYLPDNSKELDKLMFSEIGMALCYMNIWYPDIFGKRDGGQKRRVMKMIRNFCNERRHHYDDLLWLKEQIFLFQRETENMC